MPARDLLLSPDHAVLLDGLLVQAGALVNGSTITRESRVPERFTYYHVELDSHVLLLAENCPAESFVDHADRRHFSNWAERVAHGPAQPIAEMDLPRIVSQRQIPAATLMRLRQRADSSAQVAA